MALGTTAIIGIASVAVSAGGASANFIQANKQMKLKRQAEQDAKKAYEEAKKQINVNPWDALGIPKEAYELERQAFLSQGAQAIAAGQEGDRGAAATAGRIQMAQNVQQGDVRTAMSKEMQDLAKLSATEQANIKDQIAGLSLQEAQGYQTQAKEAKEARAKLIQEGTKGVTEAVKTGVETFAPLYLKQAGRDPITGEKIGKATSDQIQNAGKAIGAAGSTMSAGAAVGSVAKAPTSTLEEDRNYMYSNSGDYNYFNPLNQ
jgi:hypothetical protein